MPNIAGRLLRTAWGFPLIVAVAMGGVIANESLHERTVSGLQESSRADEAAQQANRAHYNALDRVNALRALLLEPAPRWRDRFQTASEELEDSVAFIAFFLEQNGPSGQREAAELLRHNSARRADIAEAFAEATRGNPEAALKTLTASDAANRGVALRDALRRVVERAQALQKSEDRGLVVTLNTLRWLVHGLIVAMLLSAYMLLRQALAIETTRRQESDRLTRKVEERTAQLRDLAGYLIRTREDERSRLARELHDEMGAQLSTIKLDLTRMRRNAELPRSAFEQMEQIDRRVSEVVGLKRRVIENLRPSALDHLGLCEALSLLCQENAAALQVPTHEALDRVVLQPDLELTLYRIVQEALTNTRKYSQAQQVWVRLQDQGDLVVVSVEDDGIGFDESTIGPGHHGLAGMRLRVESHGGRFEVASRPGGGTRVQASLPALRRTTTAPSP